MGKWGNGLLGIRLRPQQTPLILIGCRIIETSNNLGDTGYDHSRTKTYRRDKGDDCPL